MSDDMISEKEAEEISGAYAGDVYVVFEKIKEDLDKRIDNQLKILAGIGDEAHRYGFVKALEAYQQCKLIVEQNFEEYKNSEATVNKIYSPMPASGERRHGTERRTV